MKSPMRQAFEAWHGFEVCDEMDIQTSVAWDNWKIAWKAAVLVEREACANLCISLDDSPAYKIGGLAASVDDCAGAIRERSNK